MFEKRALAYISTALMYFKPIRKNPDTVARVVVGFLTRLEKQVGPAFLGDLLNLLNHRIHIGTWENVEFDYECSIHWTYEGVTYTLSRQSRSGGLYWYMRSPAPCRKKYYLGLEVNEARCIELHQRYLNEMRNV